MDLFTPVVAEDALDPRFVVVALLDGPLHSTRTSTDGLALEAERLR